MRLWQKFCDNHVKFVRNWYKFRTNFTLPEIFPHIHSPKIRTKFVRIHVNFFQLHANRSRDPQNLVVWGRGIVETLR